MNRLHEVSDALMEILCDGLPGVPWTEKVQGPQYPNELSGTVSCGDVEFSDKSKFDTVCIANYNISIINPDEQTTKDNPRYIEELALNVQQLLASNFNLNGFADNGRVTHIYWGTAPGRSDIGMALIKYSVEFGMEDE